MLVKFVTKQKYKEMEKYKFLRVISLLILLLAFSGCEDYFEVNPDDVLLEKDYPTTVTELYSAYMGIAAKVQDVADQGFFLEGLRGDFLEPTQNATKDMIDLYHYREGANNELANPAGYYAVIINANDYIHHVEKFYLKNPTAIDKETFGALIGGAIRYKAWAYGMLAKLYGKAVWIDGPLSEFKDLSDKPLLEFDDIFLKCIDLIENGIEIGGQAVDGKGIIRWSNVLYPGQGDSPELLEWNRICPDPEMLLAEYYLFTGNFQQVFDNCMVLIRRGGAEESYLLNKSDWTGNWIRIFREFRRMEAMFIVPYDYDRNQTNRIIEYFSNQSPNKYKLRPSEFLRDQYTAQIRADGQQGDNARGNTKTYAMQNGQWVVNKYSTGHQTIDRIHRNDVLIMLKRASDIYFWLTEALIHLERFEEARVFLNGGIEGYFDAGNGVFTPPFESYPETLYQASERNRGLGANQGIRGRAGLRPLGEEYFDNPGNMQESKKALDILLAEETSLESAAEARALFAFIRMAKRWNDPAIVADRVSAKYPEGERESIRAHLMNPGNWFINYNLSPDDLK